TRRSSDLGLRRSLHRVGRGAGEPGRQKRCAPRRRTRWQRRRDGVEGEGHRRPQETREQDGAPVLSIRGGRLPPRIPLFDATARMSASLRRPVQDGITPKRAFVTVSVRGRLIAADRKSTRLNSSHVKISYAVFCLKKKKT